VKVIPVANMAILGRWRDGRASWCQGEPGLWEWIGVFADAPGALLAFLALVLIAAAAGIADWVCLTGVLVAAARPVFSWYALRRAAPSGHMGAPPVESLAGGRPGEFAFCAALGAVSAGIG
jgi:hypothetical protein